MVPVLLNRKAAGRFATFQPGSKAQSIAPFYFAGMNLMDKYEVLAISFHMLNILCSLPVNPILIL
jgi:hypothetical protein